MGISNSVSRLADYYQRHGFSATLRRTVLAVNRKLFSGRKVVLYCDLCTQPVAKMSIPNPLTVERLTDYQALSQEDLQEMTSFWHPKQAYRNIRERFDRGASLWLMKCGDRLAGYGWTLQGCTMEPYYFPLAPEDVHLFDFYVFPQCRGRGINPLLVNHILCSLAVTCKGRAFIEAAEWNQAQLTSLKRTPFRRLGLARMFAIFGHTFASWAKTKPESDCRKLGSNGS